MTKRCPAGSRRTGPRTCTFKQGHAGSMGFAKAALASKKKEGRHAKKCWDGKGPKHCKAADDERKRGLRMMKHFTKSRK